MASYSYRADGGINATATIDLLLAHGVGIEERCFHGLTPLYRVILLVNTKMYRVFCQSEVRLLLERGADPFAEHDHCGVHVTETSYTPDDRRSPRETIGFVPRFKSLTYQDRDYDNGFMACMGRGDKAVLKVMLDAIDRKEIPFEELRDRLDRARTEAQLRIGTCIFYPSYSIITGQKDIHESRTRFHYNVKTLLANKLASMMLKRPAQGIVERSALCGTENIQSRSRDLSDPLSSNIHLGFQSRHLVSKWSKQVEKTRKRGGRTYQPPHPPTSAYHSAPRAPH
mgnify:FL=1|jgi:hypothetical protein